MKSIVFIIPSLSSGGAEHQVCNQVNYLFKNGYDVSLIVLSDIVELLSRVIIPGRNIHILGFKYLRKTSKFSVLEVRDAIKRVNLICDEDTIVLAVLPLSHLISRLSKLSARNRFTLVCYHRSLQYRNAPNNTLLKTLFYWFNCILSKRFDDIHLFISEAVEKHMSEYLPIRNGHILYNALPEISVNKQLATVNITEYFKVKPKYLVVIPGRLHPTKGHVFFINALSSYIDKYESTELGIIFLGGGPLEEKLSKLLTLQNIQNKVKITGFIDNNLLLSYLALADLVIIPSSSEGFGNVAIEALMQGSTILATKVGGLTEIISEEKKNGFLFNYGNERELRNKFSKIYENRIYRNKSIVKADFISRFTLESQMNSLVKILKI